MSVTHIFTTADNERDFEDWLEAVNDVDVTDFTDEEMHEQREYFNDLTKDVFIEVMEEHFGGPNIILKIEDGRGTDVRRIIDWYHFFKKMFAKPDLNFTIDNIDGDLVITVSLRTAFTTITVRKAVFHAGVDAETIFECAKPLGDEAEAAFENF